jgi:two-component system cell cycle sensor histidine kinase/response regulator CckA
MAGGKAVVLVVDDEQATREMERRILETGPYEVIDSPGPLEALATLKSGQKVDLLIADLEMPELSGEEMVREVRASRPGLKVLYVSGVAGRLFTEKRTLGDGEAFLSKPFTSKGLLEAVSLILYDTLSPPLRF